MDKQNYSTKMTNFSSLLVNHQNLRNTSINLLASENVLSPMVKSALANDMAGRYSSEFYGGSRYVREIIELTREYAQDLFNSEYACISPLSGHLCDLAALNAFTSPKDEIALIGKNDGGYPFDIESFGRKGVSLPFDHENWMIDYTKLPAFYSENNPKLTLLGSSVILYPTNISEFADYADQELIFDGSHVLGLIAGGKFQNPLEEGVSILFGSTHKSLPGPQGGLILSNDKDKFEQISKQFSIQSSNNPFDHNGTVLVDNIHANRIAALGVSLLEMLEFGEAYASQIIKNSMVLGDELVKHGFSVAKSTEFGVSQSHQILIPMSADDGDSVKHQLETSGILVDSFMRIGTAEVTRHGMKEDSMKIIAELINRVVNEHEDPLKIKSEAGQLAQQYSELQYCFSE